MAKTSLHDKHTAVARLPDQYLKKY